MAKHPRHKPHPHHSGRSLAGHVMRDPSMSSAGFEGPPAAEKADRMRMMASRSPVPPSGPPPAPSGPPQGFGMAAGPGGGPLPEEGP